METFPSHAELLSALTEQAPDREFTGYSFEELLIEAADYGLPVEGLIPPESDD